MRLRAFDYCWCCLLYFLFVVVAARELSFLCQATNGRRSPRGCAEVDRKLPLLRRRAVAEHRTRDRKVAASPMGVAADFCVCLFACLCESVCLFACLSACLLVCLPVYLLVCLSTCLSAYLPVCLPVCLHACLSVYLPVCLPVCLYVPLQIE